MILDEFVEVRWHHLNRDHYKNLGHTYTKCCDTFTVPISDLFKGSTIKLRVTCDFCNKETKVPANRYFNVTDKFNRYVCLECLGVERRVALEVIFNAFYERGYTPLFTEYKDNKQKLPYICSKHPQEIQYVKYNSLSIGHGCFYCGYDKVREGMRGRFVGEKSSNWRGGTRSIGAFLRGPAIREWKARSSWASKYVCALTGKKFGAIHHLNPFNILVSDVHEKLSIPIKPSIASYTREELIELEIAMKNKHETEPLGICLTEAVHNKFHRMYGSHLFTPENFYEFASKYKEGLIEV